MAAHGGRPPRARNKNALNRNGGRCDVLSRRSMESFANAAISCPESITGVPPSGYLRRQEFAVVRFHRALQRANR